MENGGGACMGSIGEEGEGAMLGGKPLTLYELKMQRLGAAEVGSGGRLEMDRILVNPVRKRGRRRRRRSFRNCIGKDDLLNTSG